MVDVCREMGVRTNVPFKDLTDREKKIVFEGPAEKKHILYKGGKNSNPVELDFTYFNAVYTVENALAKVKDESGMKRVAKFLKEDACPDCGGTRLSEKAARRFSTASTLHRPAVSPYPNSSNGSKLFPLPSPKKCARWHKASANRFWKTQNASVIWA